MTSYRYSDRDLLDEQTSPVSGTARFTYNEHGELDSETDARGVTVQRTVDELDRGHTPQLQSITFGDGSGTDTYAYDAAGDLTGITGTRALSFDYDDAGRLAAIDPGVSPPSTTLTYDGRSFLERSLFQASPTQAAATDPTYSSDGRLHHFRRATTGGTPRHQYVFYFGDRPVATLAADESGGGLANPLLTYLSTDHLGTPILATDPAGAEVWSGGFEPFGEDYAGAQAAGVFLRLPGQWEDLTWGSGNLASGLYYNVHRWYENGAGRYTRTDPAWDPARVVDINPYLYARANPLRLFDRLGLATFVGFPPGRENDARQALDRAKEKLQDQPCCTGGRGLTEKLLRRLDSPGLVIKYDEGLRVCGRTPVSAVVGLRKKFKIGPGAWNCCIENLPSIESLASTFIHEVSHFSFGGEQRAQDVEERCFGCTTTPRQ